MSLKCKITEAIPVTVITLKHRRLLTVNLFLMLIDSLLCQTYEITVWTLQKTVSFMNYDIIYKKGPEITFRTLENFNTVTVLFINMLYHLTGIDKTHRAFCTYEDSLF